MTSNAFRPGIARSSVIVIIVCAVVIVAVAANVLRKARLDAWALRESMHIYEIHQAWVNFANSNKAFFPIPRLLNRPASTTKDQRSARFGPWAESKNTTANIYSALIAQHYFKPSILISPFERNPAVVEDLDYNYSAFNPSKGTQWDNNFVADLKAGSNVSFAHMPAVGRERLDHWRSSAGDRIALLGNRGPADGVARADLFSCRRDGSWAGTFVFGDGHVEAFEIFNLDNEFTSILSHSSPIFSMDNPFNFDDGAGLDFDQVIAFTQEVQDNQAILQHD